MANYANLLATIATNIYTNNNNEVTAASVQAAVNAMVASLGAGYQFMGVAHPSDTSSGYADLRAFWLADEAGTYTNFGGLVVNEGEVAVLMYNGSWSKEVTGVATVSKLVGLDARLAMLGSYLVPLLKKIAYEENDAKSLIDSIGVLLSNAELLTISANYTQPGTIYAGEPLEDLQDGLVVMAHYDNGTDIEITNYVLSGSLTAGTSTITVTFMGKTTTFTVTVTDALYFVPGKMMPSQVAIRNSVSSSYSYDYGVTIDGVYYFFTNAYSVSSNAISRQRCCYPTFDLLLTAGRRYRFIVEFTAPLTNDQTVQASNGYYDATYQAAGIANVKQVCNYSGNVQATSWADATKSGNVVSFEEVVPAGYVGVRTTLKLLNSGADSNWTLTVKRFIIQDVTE